MKILSRLWTGIVSAVAAVALSLVLDIVGIMLVGLPAEWIQWITLAFAAAGFMAGFIVGNRDLTGRKQTRGSAEESNIWID